MKKIIIAAIVCGLTMGSMLIGFNLYQQKQEEIRQEELRLEEEARLKAEAEEKARQEAEEKAKQEELKKQKEAYEKAWKTKYVEVVKEVAKEYRNAVSEITGEYYGELWVSILNRYGNYISVTAIRELIDSNDIITQNIKTIKDLKSKWVLDMNYLKTYPDGYYQAYQDLNSLIYWTEKVTDDLTSDTFLYETEKVGMLAQMDLLQMTVDSLNSAGDKVEVWANIYDHELYDNKS